MRVFLKGFVFVLLLAFSWSVLAKQAHIPQEVFAAIENAKELNNGPQTMASAISGIIVLIAILMMITSPGPSKIFAIIFPAIFFFGATNLMGATDSRIRDLVKTSLVTMVEEGKTSAGTRTLEQTLELGNNLHTPAGVYVRFQAALNASNTPEIRKLCSYGFDYSKASFEISPQVVAEINQKCSSGLKGDGSIIYFK